MNESTGPPTPAKLAECRLREAHYRFSRCVTCKYREGCLELLGNVPTYYLKQMAQTVVADVPGVERIDNRIQVFAAIETQTGRRQAKHDRTK